MPRLQRSLKSIAYNLGRWPRLLHCAPLALFVTRYRTASGSDRIINSP